MNADTLQQQFGLDPELTSCPSENASDNGEVVETRLRNEHLASIYESQAAQFRAVVPFIRQGLERGERCLYVVDDNSKADVLKALRDGDVDVEAALNSGALTIHTKHETYLRPGEFETGAMLDFWEETLTEARDVRGYAGVRAAAEMTWALDEETGTNQLAEYEAKLNNLYDGEDYTVLCQYNRNRFPLDVLADVIHTHPFVIYEGTVCENYYYDTPEEFFAADSSPSDIEPILTGLVERTKTELALREREREVNRVVNLMTHTERIADVGGWEIDPETKEVFWSDQLFEILGIPNEQGQPSLENALNVYHEEDRSLVAKAVERALETGEPIDVEARFRSPNGETRWLYVQGEPEIEDGEIVALRGAAQDITDRKQREQALEESHERLEEFASAVSHDLQEPLSTVANYLQLLERRYEMDLDKDAEEFIDFAVNGATRMQEMIDGLVTTYAEVEKDGRPFAPVDLDPVIEEVLVDLATKIDATDANITTEPLPAVAGDSGQLRQLFMNLVDNAIKYAGDEPPRVHIAVERVNEMYEFSVSDNGIGIDPRATDKIFDVFSRLHSDEEYPGTGIGLALCERIVERHGGEIWVESTPGEGSTFYFTLPAET